MLHRQRALAALFAAALLTAGAGTAGAAVVDDFEGGLPYGVDADGVSLGLFSFSGDGSVSLGIAGAPQPPGAAPGNSVLQVDIDVTNFGGVVHLFENPAVDTWTPRDWSSFTGLTFWLHGNNSGTELFVDVIDNRNDPALPQDDAERFTTALVDDFSGWKQISLDFSSFVRKDIGNGAPNDGLGLTQVHGWAFGTLATGGLQTYYLDSVQVVPEPGSWALMAAGLAAVAAAARRRRA